MSPTVDVLPAYSEAKPADQSFVSGSLPVMNHQQTGVAGQQFVAQHRPPHTDPGSAIVKDEVVFLGQPGWIVDILAELLLTPVPPPLSVRLVSGNCPDLNIAQSVQPQPLPHLQKEHIMYQIARPSCQIQS